MSSFEPGKIWIVPEPLSTLESQREFELVVAEKMRRGGLRVTSARMLVIRALSDTDRPMTASQVHQAVVASGGHIDMVSVYRVLQALVKLDLIHHVGSLDRFTLCRLDHHVESWIAHLVCRDCGKVEEMEIDSSIASIMLESATDRGYRDPELRLETLGVCPSCATS